MSTAYDTVLATPFRRLGLSFDQGRLAALDFIDGDQEEVTSLDISVLQAVAEIKQYCQNADHAMNIELQLEGTDFQKRVWQAIADIPKGEVRSYGQLAEQLESSARAVGNACAANPVPVVIPCHRVVASDSLGGYCGETFEKSPRGLMRIKAWLLLHEGVLKAQVDGEPVSDEG
ncbi:methylated-DNA (protein)-cysteine S-methyltransferase [gamma proteobacterium HTCC5015]|nr:methylated-DNA (protein)-cysteine S-methyltransferase [gamma proteobacterium HTCC5015]